MTRQVANNLFRGEGASTRLLAGRSRADGRVVFPYPSGADEALFDLVELPREGTLWSYTVQRFRPKPPFDGDGDDASFQSYGVGYIEIADHVIVEARLATRDFSALRIGEAMCVTTEVYRHDADGDAVLTYAFQPSREGN